MTDTTQNKTSALSVDSARQRKGALSAQLKSMKMLIQDAVPKGLRKTLTPERVTRLVMSAASAPGSSILDCTTASVAQCVSQAVSLGLEPGGGTGECYLVPFRNYGEMQCQLIIGYRGVIALARRSGKLLAIEAKAVYEHDYLRVRFGTHSEIIHEPQLRGSRGEIVSVYCVAHLAGDGPPQQEWMSIDEVKQSDGYQRAAGSRRKSESPWTKHFAEMAKKTIVLRASKLLPISPQLSEALAIDADSFKEAPPAEPADSAEAPIDDIMGHIAAQADKMRAGPTDD